MDIPSKFPWEEGTLPNGDRFIKCAEGKDVAYFPPHTSIYHGDRRAANIRYVMEMPAKLADAQAEIARLRGALERAVSFVEHAEVSSGVCCCGDDMERHANPMDCGHSPRDMWDYAAEGFIKETRALLDTK